MSKNHYIVSILIMLIILSIAIPPSFAEIPKPGVPEFSVAIVKKTLDTAPTSTIDPFTGENITHPGAHTEWNTIEVTVRNQPFTPYKENDAYIEFFYNVRAKGHFGEDWTNLFYASEGYPVQSNSDYTVIDLGTAALDFPFRGTVDFQVEAMIGYTTRVVEGSAAPWRFIGEKSGWSSIQTLTISQAAPTPSASFLPSPSPSPTPTEFVSSDPVPIGFFERVGIFLLLAIIVGLVLLVVVFLRRRSTAAPR